LLAGQVNSFYDDWQNLTGFRNVTVVTNMPVLIGNCRLNLPLTLPQFGFHFCRAVADGKPCRR
jgi:hypothetical protein